MNYWTLVKIGTLSLTGLSCWLGTSRIASAQGVPESFLPPEIERSLIEGAAPDFFHQGIARFEREIQQLSEKKQAASEESEPILQVRPETSYPQAPENSERRDWELDSP